MHAEKESLSGQRLSKDHGWRISEINWVSGAENFNEKIVKPHLLSRYTGIQERGDEDSDKRGI